MRFTPPIFMIMALTAIAPGCGSKPAAIPTTEGPPPIEVAVETPAATLASPEMIERESGATVWIHTIGDVRIHTFMAPFEAFANTTHVVEGPTRLVVVDPQMTIGTAGDARAYVDSLGKPVDRLIASHAHPDHYLGIAAAWEDVPTTALAGTIEEIRTTGEATRQAREAMFPAGWLSDHVTAPATALDVGAQTIDGIDYRFESFRDAEHHEQLVIRLPALNVTIAQDLVYTVVHPIITDRTAIGSWQAHMDTLLEAGDTSLVLAGHGPPTDATGLTDMKAYLSAAQGLLDASDDPQAFKTGIIAAFPERSGEAFVDFTLFFVFPQAAGAGHE